MITRQLLALTAGLALASPVMADDDDDRGFGLAGILSARNKENLEPIQLGGGIPLTSAPWVLKSGT